MSKTIKIWLIIAACLVLLGCVLFGSVMMMLKWDFSLLSTRKYETNTHTVSEDFSSLSISADTANITLAPTTDATCTVVCHELQSAKHAVSVKDGVLSVEMIDERKWYEYIGIDFGSPTITVYLPSGAYGSLTVTSDTGDVTIPSDFTFESMTVTQNTGDVTSFATAAGAVKIKTSTGDIRLEGISAASLELSVSTGDVYASSIICAGDVTVTTSTGDAMLKSVTCKNLTSTGGTGDLTLRDVVATEKLLLERGSGDVELDACDAAELSIKTGTGDVEGTLLSDKIFITKTGTGDVDVPDTHTGGRCEITTGTGDIELTIGGHT